MPPFFLCFFLDNEIKFCTVLILKLRTLQEHDIIRVTIHTIWYNYMDDKDFKVQTMFRKM